MFFRPRAAYRSVNVHHSGEGAMMRSLWETIQTSTSQLSRLINFRNDHVSSSQWSLSTECCHIKLNTWTRPYNNARPSYPSFIANYPWQPQTLTRKNLVKMYTKCTVSNCMRQLSIFTLSSDTYLFAQMPWMGFSSDRLLPLRCSLEPYYYLDVSTGFELWFTVAGTNNCFPMPFSPFLAVFVSCCETRRC
jgi:hypothetical protein